MLIKLMFMFMFVIKLEGIKLEGIHEGFGCTIHKFTMFQVIRIALSFP